MTGVAPTGTPLVSILVVAYNSVAFISDCIASVIAHTAPGTYEILLVDNGKDGTADKVATEFPMVRIIPGQGNIGFARANNLLAEHARGEYLLLLNPDTELFDPAIDRLLDFARSRPDGWAWGGLTTYPDGNLDGGNFLSIPSVGGILQTMIGLSDAAKLRARLVRLDQPIRVDVLCGGFMLISRTAWDALRGFDPTFLLYSEEIDLFTRLKRQGGVVWLTPDCRIIHDVGGGNAYSPARIRFVYTGLMHYAHRHWRAPLAQIVGAAYWLTAARWWLVSALLSPISASHRDRRRAVAPILAEPGAWWRGYAGRSSLD